MVHANVLLDAEALAGPEGLRPAVCVHQQHPNPSTQPPAVGLTERSRHFASAEVEASVVCTYTYMYTSQALTAGLSDVLHNMDDEQSDASWDSDAEYPRYCVPRRCRLCRFTIASNETVVAGEHASIRR
jgi:hypothetical protein